jgi:CRP-like cAMP-binding protein
MGDEFSKNYFLNNFKDLEPEDFNEIFQHTKEITLRSKDIFIDLGSNNKNVGFIVKGLIRAYCIDEEGEEKTVLLRLENQFVASHEVIILNKPSRFIYEALENTFLVSVDYNVLKKLIYSNPKLEQIKNDFLLMMLSESLTRMEEFVLLSPEQRYLKLISSNPGLLNRVPDKYIANLIGITAVSLSRIRKRIKEESK